MFHDPAHIALGVGEHPPVAAGIIEPGGEQGYRSPCTAVLANEPLQGFRAQQGHIPIEHQQIPLKTGEGFEQLLDGMAGAVLGLLQHKFQATQVAE